MIRRSFRVGLRLGLVVGIVAAVAKLLQSRRAGEGRWSGGEPASWPPMQESPVVPEAPARATPEAPAAAVTLSPTAEQAAAPAETALLPEPAPAPAPEPTPEPAPAPAPAPEPTPEPVPEPTLWVEPEGGVCPPSHPVKAKLSSGLFHLPGMAAYNRTRPDRCYADEATAARDGLTRAKR